MNEKWESEEQLFLVEDLILFTKEIIAETVHERVNKEILDWETDTVLQLLQEELIADEMMTTLYEVTMELVFENLLNEILKKYVWEQGPAICKDLGVTLIMERPSKPKSKVVDIQMEKILQEIIIQELALAIATPEVGDDELNEELDFAIMQTLLNHI